ncbi:MAG: carboxypeptidase-like regulatory domain-containing protein [Nitrospiria bacterium]
MSMMGMKKFSWNIFIAFVVMAVFPVLMLTGCGSSSSSGGTGTVSGVITDSSGAPIGGATVVAGTSSPTAITDKDGNFTITGVPSGTVSINVITPGYNTNTFSVNVSNNATTTIPAAIHLPDVDDMGNAPLISNASAPFSNGVFAVTATITATTNMTITDARAELVGYGIGNVMTANGPTYTASISLPGSFIGPSAVIKIFAIDSKGRVGVKVLVVAVPGALGTGSFNGTTLNGSWGGSAEYHHASFGNGDLLGDKRFANVSLSVSGSTVTGNTASINIESFMPVSGWGVTTSSFTGSSTLIDASLGLYEITSTFNPSSSRTVTLDMLGKLDSAVAPSSFVGYFKAKIIDTAPSNTTILLGHFSLKNNLTWTNSDLDGNWVWSEFIKTSAINITYNHPFQYNSSFTATSGNFSGKDTLGYTLSTTTNFSMIDASVGKFGGTVSSSDGSTATFVGLLGPYKRHVTGLFTVSSGGNNAYGPFWGSKIATPPQYATEDFSEKRFDGSVGNSIWRGFYFVSGNHDNGNLCYISIKTDINGNVTGGKILPIAILGTSCPTVNFTSGALSFTDTTDGQISGSATNGITMFTLAPANSRNASMGVYKARLAGDFSVNVTGGPDTGFFFLQRVLIE